MRFRVVAIITVCLAILQIGSLLTSGYAALAIRHGDQAVHAVVADHAVSLDLIDSINHLRSVRSMLAASLAAGQAQQPAEAATLLNQARSKYALALSAMQRYQQAAKEPAEQALQPALQASFQRYTQQGLQPLITAVAKLDVGSYNRLLTGTEIGDDRAFEKVLDQSFALHQQTAKAMIADTHRRADRAFRLQAVAAVLLLLVAVLMRWVLVQTVARPLQSAVTLANAVAAGELGHRLQLVEGGRHEVSRLLRALGAMDVKLVSIVEQVRASSVEISAASEQISRGNDDLSHRTQAQAASLEETAATMEEMTASIREHAAHARHANTLMGTSRQLAAEGDLSSKQAMQAIQDLSMTSGKIAEIVGLIDEIAFQTNILALNAAVEAARAGDQGRSFAVVAGEVRALAQRCAGASAEVRSLVGESVSQIGSCEQLTRSSNEGLARIFDSIGQMSDIFGEIAASSQEQSEAITQVNQGVVQMDDNTQQNAALVEEASAAARALHEQALGLVRQVAFFKLG